MASTAMFSLYSSWDKFDRNDHITFDEDKSCALSSYRQLPQVDKSGRMSVEPPAIEAVMEPESLESTAEKDFAVQISNCCFKYGSGEKVVHAMKSVNLQVPRGEIYGLLGPSGCGKTTLLRCLVGRLQVDSGSIKVFGKDSNTSVPGPLIGYMPQELALFPDFTIQETLFFFARLFGMKDKKIKERVRFLVSFLELPDKDRLVGNLSGGQKRRVSLAVALVHSPPLLILDEPTVGVDPVLRQTIWDYLVSLSKEQRLTVIITTHYIEEARAANVVGLMRYGKLLVEASPDLLLRRFNMTTLEEVFLKLCQLDQMNQTIRVHSVNENSKPDICAIVDGGQDIPEVVSPAKGATTSSIPVDDSHWIKRSSQKTSALFQKNIIRLRRNLPVLLFQFLLPSIEVILFCICIGRDPFNIPVAIYNEEASGEYSHWFLDKIDNNTITQVNHESLESALQSVKSGHAWAAMSIGGNFSQALQLRVLMAGSVDNATVDHSNVDMYLDMTSEFEYSETPNHHLMSLDQIIGYQLQRTILYAWRAFSADVASKMGQNPAAFEFPVQVSFSTISDPLTNHFYQFETPVYGGQSPSFTEFMAPGVLLSISFLAAVALTALAFVMERKEGLLERSLVAGVTSYEFLLSHVLTQLLVLTVQIFLLLIFTFLVFEIPSEGPFFWVLLLTLLQGSCGMAYGLMISALCKEENSATMLALGSFYPNLLLSGTVWPVQAMPDAMRYISYILPQTIPIESMRYILSRGWDPSYPEVAIGFGITIAWTTFFLVSAVVIFQMKK